MAAGGETVVLVHGLWMHGIVFALFRRQLARRGFVTRSFSYPSVRAGLSQNVSALARFVGDIHASDASRIHLVGHSLGGLIVLGYLAQRPDPRIARAVLMGTPYGGSHCATGLMALPGGRALVGHSLPDWFKAPPPELPAAVEVGILAGDRSFGLGRVIPGLPRPNDGVVAVAETRLPGARDSVVLPVAHSQMLISGACVDQVASFLASGRFAHD